MNLFLDMEMLSYGSHTGCDMNSIIAIGLTSLNGKFNFHSTVHPGYNKFKVNRITKDLTGITKDDLDSSPKFPEVFKMLEKSLRAPLYTSDGVTFYTWGHKDSIVWNNLCERYKLKSRFKFIDFQEVLMSNCKLQRQPSLVKTIELVNNRYILEHHNPLDDAKMLKSIFKKYKKFPKEVELVLRRAEFEKELLKLQRSFKDVLEFQLDDLIL